MNAAVQMMVVGLLLGWSLLVVRRRFFPRTMTALRQRLAAQAAAQGRPRLAAWLGREPAAAAGCDGGCSSCRTGCATSPAPQPVQWRQPPSSGCH